ncbi:MAG: flagellar biosynthesis anti-sigma factor FlgM [Pseudomonadota bacterium]
MKVNDYISGPGASPYTGDIQTKSQEVKGKPQEEKPETAGAEDKVQLSERSREIARAQEFAAMAPEVRSDKVAEIKAKLSSGTYDVKASQVADKLLKSVISENV